MSTTTFPDAATGSATVPLALRRLDESGILLPLVAEKITIGGGQSCTLRLSDTDVRPLHCLVTRGPDGLVVRRWSDGTLLNGDVFSEAPLAVGDRLAIGPIELELVEYISHQDPTEELADSHPEVSEPAVEDATEPQSELAIAADLPEGHGSAAARAANNRLRARRLTGEVRRWREAYDEVRLNLAELEERVCVAVAERAGLEMDRNNLADQLTANVAELAAVKDELAAAQEASQQREQELSNRVVDLQQQLAERNSIIEELKAELLRVHEEKDPSTPAQEVVEACQPGGGNADSPAAETDEAASGETGTVVVDEGTPAAFAAERAWDIELHPASNDDVERNPARPARTASPRNRPPTHLPGLPRLNPATWLKNLPCPPTKKICGDG